MDPEAEATIGVHELAGSERTEAEPEVSPIPLPFYLSLFIPTFFVVVWGMQRLMAPRVPLQDVLDARAALEDEE